MFVEKLKIELSLKIGMKSYTISGADVVDLQLEMFPYGYRGRLSFTRRDNKDLKGLKQDEVYKPFLTNDLIEVSLKVTSDYQTASEFKNPLELDMTGLVTDKAFEEDLGPPEQLAKPYITRTYTIDFADAAFVLWPQHFPCELYVDKDMKTVIDKQKNKHIKLVLKAKELTTKHPILFLPLGDLANQASFYDFIHWYCDQQHMVFAYDYTANAYSILDDKISLKSAYEPVIENVSGIRFIIPESNRQAVTVLNADSEQKTVRKEVENSDGVEGVRRDVLIRTPVAKEFDGKVSLETKRLIVRDIESILNFADCPRGCIYPGTPVKFTKQLWSKKAFQQGEDFRIRTSHFHARKHFYIEGNAGSDSSEFEVSVQLHLEKKAEKYIARPQYQTPHYPVAVEGHVVSDTGKKTEETYQFYEDKKNSLEHCKVTIPLFDKQQVIVLYSPEMHSSQFYFPAIRDARVLLHFDFQSATIVRHLEWRPGARLPQDTQGNHILFGHTDKSKTTVQHLYEESKPVLFINRVNEKDTELIRLEEGTMILETKENK